MERSGGRNVPPLLRREGELLQDLLDFGWVLEDWKDATRGRRGGMDGIETLNHQKLLYWRLNRDIAVTQWEMDVLLMMDERYLQELQTPLADAGTDKEREDG